MVRPAGSPSPATWRRAAVLLGALLAVGSLLPGGGGPTLVGPIGLGADKYLHAGGYAALAVTVAAALAAERPPLRAAVVALVVAVGWGLALELGQAAVPGRAFDTADLVANAVGALLGAGAWRAWRLGREN